MITTTYFEGGSEAVVGELKPLLECGPTRMDCEEGGGGDRCVLWDDPISVDRPLRARLMNHRSMEKLTKIMAPDLSSNVQGDCVISHAKHAT